MKRKKKSKKNKKRKPRTKRNNIRRNKKIRKKKFKRAIKRSKKKTIKKKRSKKKSSGQKIIKRNSKETFRKIIRLGERFKPSIKINFNLDKTLQNFFQNIADKIQSFKDVIEEERLRKRKEKLKILEREKKEEIKKTKMLKDQELKKKLLEVKEEQRLEKERKIELRKFIKEDQAQLRKEQAARQRKFYEKIKLEKKIDQFRKREELEIRNLEKFVLRQERENYKDVEERILKIKQKYQAIRDQKIRERIEQLGIQVSDSDTRADLLEKEYQFNLAREKIENTLESFYRSMVSCVFQLNRKWLPKKMSLLRVIDRRYETSEIFIKLDEESDDSWIMLLYLKDNNPDSDIILEDKTNPEKKFSKEFKSSEIFQFSDLMVDSLTSLIDREYKKKLN